MDNKKVEIERTTLKRWEKLLKNGFADSVLLEIIDELNNKK